MGKLHYINGQWTLVEKLSDLQEYLSDELLEAVDTLIDIEYSEGINNGYKEGHKEGYEDCLSEMRGDD